MGVIFIVVILLASINLIEAISTTVTTDKGVIVGSIQGSMISFYGVPYAQPPVGNLRWQPPMSRTAWTTPIQTTSFSAACMQNPTSSFTFPADISYSEDCLYLNIWVTNSTKMNKPVLIWFHGGGYTQGGNSELRLRGNYMSLSSDSIVVNINYRLGIFGWLGHPAFAKDNPSHPTTGNYGLLDQRMALNWVKTNIAAFGGNPAEVTIMGESAGATSVCLHMISPNSFGLYSKAIAESSACYTETQSLQAVNQQAEMVQKYLNCSGSVSQVATCLRGVSAPALLTASNTMHYTPYAVVDGQELPLHPYLAISSGKVNAVPLLSGNVLNEGTLFAKVPQPLSFNAYMQYLIKLFSVANPLVLEQYPCNASTPDCWPVLASVIGDFYLVCPTKQLADSLLSSAVPNYAYLFTHIPEWSVQVFPKGGAFHSSEIPFVFSTLATAYTNSTTAENYLSNQMTELWTNFGNTGNPNQPRNISEIWPAYTATNGTRIVFDTTLSLISSWKLVECQFWDIIYRLMYTTGY